MDFKNAKNVFIKRYFWCSVIALFVCWFMKIVGFDLFGLDLENKFLNDLELVIYKNLLIKDIIMIILLNIQLYFMVGIVNKEQGKKVWLYLLKLLPLTILCRYISINIFPNVSALIEILFLILVLSKLKLKNITKSILIVLLNTLYQASSLIIRDLGLGSHDWTFVASQLLSIDYYIILYLHKEMEVNVMGNDGTWILFGFTAWLYGVVGFIWGIIWGIFAGPIIKAKEWYAKGKAKEDARKTKK